MKLGKEWWNLSMSKIKLTQTCSITTGKLDANAAEENGIYPYFTCAPEPLKINTFAFDDDVILLAGNNASGNFHCQRYTGKFNAYQRTYVITANEGYDLDYIYYNLLINLQILKNHSQGSQTKFLTMQILDAFEIEDIEISAQKKISSVLSSIDAKIRNNNAINFELETLAKTIFDYWFLQYEFPDSMGKPYKTNGGVFLRDEQIKGDIPIGWEVKNLSCFILNSKNGDWGDENPIATDDIKINCFRGADFPCITENYVMTAPIRYIRNSNADRVLEDGDLVTEISGGSPTQSTGRIGYINSEFLDRSENKMTCSNFCKAFTPTRKIYQFWLYQMWKTHYDSGIMFNFESKTTGIKNLMFDEFIKNVFVACPDDELVAEYQTICESYYATIQKNLKQNQELSGLRDFLLPMLINGQVSVKDC